MNAILVVETKLGIERRELEGVRVITIDPDKSVRFCFGEASELNIPWDRLVYYEMHGGKAGRSRFEEEFKEFPYAIEPR